MAAIVSSPTVALLRAPLASHTARKAPAGGISQLRSAARPAALGRGRSVAVRCARYLSNRREWREHLARGFTTLFRALRRPFLASSPSSPRPPRLTSLIRSSIPSMLRASAPVDSVVSGVNQAIPQVADVFGIDTSAADTVFVNAASIILPAWGAIVGAIFVFGTIYKIAFPDKYNEQVYSGKAAEMVQDEMIDLDNLSEEDLAAVAELEAERAAQK